METGPPRSGTYVLLAIAFALIVLGAVVIPLLRRTPVAVPARAPVPGSTGAAPIAPGPPRGEAAATSWSPGPGPSRPGSPVIEVVFALDTTRSMEGFIDGARRRI